MHGSGLLLSRGVIVKPEIKPKCRTRMIRSPSTKYKARSLQDAYTVQMAVAVAIERAAERPDRVMAFIKNNPQQTDDIADTVFKQTKKNTQPPPTLTQRRLFLVHKQIVCALCLADKFDIHTQQTATPLSGMHYHCQIHYHIHDPMSPAS